jgi:hypothetical protein
MFAVPLRRSAFPVLSMCPLSPCSDFLYGRAANTVLRYEVFRLNFGISNCRYLIGGQFGSAVRLTSRTAVNREVALDAEPLHVQRTVVSAMVMSMQQCPPIGPPTRITAAFFTTRRPLDFAHADRTVQR